jgi:hypothetical protein
VDLVRSWLGQALRATGAAIVVPVACLVALSLTSLGGAGLGGLGSLSQIVSGPSAAGDAPLGDTGDDEISEAVQQLAAARTGVDISAPAGGTGTGGSGTGGGGTGGGGGEENGGDGGDGDRPGGGGDPGDPNPPTDPGDPGDPGGGGGDPPDSPPPEDDPGVVEGVGDDVKDVTNGTPVGPTIEEAVDGLIETCGRLGCP